MSAAVIDRRLPLAAAVAAVLLGGCGATTYGTGTTPGVQTLKDVSGIISFSSEEEEEIAYRPRAPVVMPPTAGGPLPPPATAPRHAALDWPDDPEDAGELNEADLAALQSRIRSRGDGPRSPAAESDTDFERFQNRGAETRALMADARRSRGGSVDADGNPIRRALVEPPSQYRIPSDEAPTEIVPREGQKPKRWWQFWNR